MATERDVHRAIAAWYAVRQIPVRERLRELLADYSPEPAESTTGVICRMAPADQAEALDLAGQIDPYGDAARRALAARPARSCGHE